MTIEQQRIADAKQYVANKARLEELKKTDIVREMEALEKDNKAILKRLDAHTGKNSEEFKLGKWLVHYFKKRVFNKDLLFQAHPELNEEDYKVDQWVFKSITKA